MPALSVHLNRNQSRELTAPATFTARQPFDVVFENHGEGTRVHLHPEGELANVVRVADDNRLVGTDSTERVRIDFQRVEQPITGTLDLSVGYGAESTSVELTLAPYIEDESGVDVDEQLSKPPNRAKNDDQSLDLPSIETAAIVGLGLLVLVVAAVVAAVVESIVVALGATIVVLAVLVALVAVLR